MKAVIMAGGEGTRLRPLTSDRPKPLVPVCNRPVMAYTLDLLAQHGTQEVFITLGYMPDAVTRCFGDVYKGMSLHYVVEASPLGTVGSVAALRSNLDHTFLVISGDVLTDVDLGELLRFHRDKKALLTLAATRVPNPLQYGIIMTDRRGRIRRFLEKPGWSEVYSDLVNMGIYIMEPEALTGIPAHRHYDFSRDLFPALLEMEAPMYAAAAEGYWCDIGDTSAYLQANIDLLLGKMRFQPSGEEVAPHVWVESDRSEGDRPEGNRPEGNWPEGVAIEGPVLIGAGCRLAPGTRLEAGVVLGPRTVTERGAVLRRTVTWSDVQIEAGAFCIGAILCDQVTAGDSSSAFEGAVIGASCRLGERAIVSPGVRLWPRTTVGNDVCANIAQEKSNGGVR